MELFDALMLARLQFAFTVSLHIIFPAFTIGLASYLAVLEALWLITGRGVFMSVFNYWKKIFALSFGMGVVSGIVMSYQFGTNWSVFSDKAGSIIGPLMGYEVLSAFFLEAGFLGVMLFGRERVGKNLHMFATLMVALGTFLSAFWILSANSWMHTPTGYAINADGQFVPASWWAIIFNPSFPYRLVHMVLAAYLTTAFVVGSVGAFHLLRDSHNERARVMFSMAMWMAVVVAPIQIIAGDMHGLNTLEHQPAKIAAIEGHFNTSAGHRSCSAGPTCRRDHRTRSRCPAGSLVLTHAWREVKGLAPGRGLAHSRSCPELPHQVGLGLLMVLLGLFSPERASRPAVRLGRTAPLCRRHGSVRVRRHAGRLDHHRGRAPALHRLPPAAHGPVGLADRRAGGRRLAAGLHRRVFRRVRRRHVLHPAPDEQHTRHGRAGHRARRAGPRRRHYAGLGAGYRAGSRAIGGLVPCSIWHSSGLF
jgi:cytochrome d ubiquinol oxidase subunit I